MFIFKKSLSLFCFIVLLSLFVLPLMTTAHQSNVCPLHHHTTSTIGTCNRIFELDSWWDPMTGCFHNLRCILGVRYESRRCPDGVQDICKGCDEATNRCNQHEVWCGTTVWWSNCDEPGLHVWFTCQYDSCPFGPSS